MSDETASQAVVRAERNVLIARERVGRSVDALRTELSRRADWHEWVAHRPATFLVTSFALGFLLGQRR